MTLQNRIYRPTSAHISITYSTACCTLAVEFDNLFIAVIIEEKTFTVKIQTVVSGADFGLFSMRNDFQNFSRITLI